MNENFSLFASSASPLVSPPRVHLFANTPESESASESASNNLAVRSASFGRSAASLVGAFLVALALLLAASRADAQEGRVMRDEGIRYIKLAGTYREAQNYDLALKYANKGLQMVANQGSQYWQAAGYEALGLIYRDMGDKRTALDNLYRASDIYGRIIKQRDGSPNAVSMLIQDVEQSPEVNDASMTALRDENQRSQELNRQLNERMNSLDSRIRQIDGKGTNANTTAASRREAAPLYRDDTPSNVRPQGSVAQFGVDKKPRPQPPAARVATDTAKTVERLPVVSIKLGAGTGYGINATTLTLSYVLASVSIDIFLSDQFSVGVLGAYLFNLNTVPPPTPTYQLVDLRLAYHPFRTNAADVYLGVAGGVHWPSPALQWHAGLLVGWQVNFAPAVGFFVEGTLGAVNNVYRVPAETGFSTRGVIGIGGHARLGLAFNF
jgi:tetratricopeptide (TPR) repeat protein